jgi:hypothetical protein
MPGLVVNPSPRQLSKALIKWGEYKNRLWQPPYPILKQLPHKSTVVNDLHTRDSVIFVSGILLQLTIANVISSWHMSSDGAWHYFTGHVNTERIMEHKKSDALFQDVKFWAWCPSERRIMRSTYHRTSCNTGETTRMACNQSSWLQIHRSGFESRR